MRTISLKKEVNKHPKFDKYFDIQHQLEHFEYAMIHALVKKTAMIILSENSCHFVNLNTIARIKHQ